MVLLFFVPHKHIDHIGGSLQEGREIMMASTRFRYH